MFAGIGSELDRTTPSSLDQPSSMEKVARDSARKHCVMNEADRFPINTHMMGESIDIARKYI